MMTETSIDLKDYIEAAGTASSRVRVVLVFIIIASILAGAAVFNTRPTDWTTLRIDALKAKLAALSGQNDLDAEQKAELEWTRNYMSVLLRERADNLYVRLPFFGVVIDINDLGPVGGFSFVILLIMFRFSIKTELAAHGLAFLKAKEAGRLQECYDLLATTQVLSSPSLRTIRHNQFWRLLPKGLFALPLLVGLYVFVQDLWTIQLVLPENPIGTWIIIAFSTGFLALILILTVSTFLLSREFDGMWTEVAAQLD